MSADAPTLPPYDPYAPRPNFLQRHGEAVAAAVVFVLTILLTVVAFPPFHNPEFAYAMLVPGAYWAYTRPRFKVFAWTLFAAQAVAWTILLGWLHYVTWLGLLLLGPFVGAWVGSWYAAAWWILPRMIGRPTMVRLASMCGLAAVWVLIEWSRTWLLSGFPWLTLSASQWSMVSMLQIAAYTGAIGVSFVVVMVNLGFTAYAHRLFREGVTGLNKRSQEFFLALFLVLACFSIHVQDTFNRGRYSVPLARVAFVQPDIPQDLKWDVAKARENLAILERTTMEAAATRPDLILWPEAATPISIRGDADGQAWVEGIAKKFKVPLLIGSTAIENSGKPDEHWYNGVFLITPDEGEKQDFYAKRHLVPFGEYVPMRALLGWLKKIVPIGDEDATPGKDSAPILVPLPGGSVVFGPLICYEDIFPELARTSALGGSQVLAVVTNNGWFGEGSAAYQHAAHAVLRAVETRRPVLRCGNAGWSGWIDEFGNVRSVLTNDAGTIYYRGTKTVSVTRDSRWVGKNSFYVEYGDWFVLLCLGLTMLTWFLLRVDLPAPSAETAPESAE